MKYFWLKIFYFVILSIAKLRNYPTYLPLILFFNKIRLAKWKLGHQLSWVQSTIKSLWASNGWMALMAVGSWALEFHRSWVQWLEIRALQDNEHKPDFDNALSPLGFYAM
jgi:hypothetical protein